ncbi:MAG: hypothetical protein HYT88_04100 [Candidatus Omnitrophica bacterium]|nr:hypothetical protein [Candidatus Omnitrophota bacterium]MBI3010728.1 hypothetical protein [Candidatus Omnitrophota bacterium]
MITGLLFVLFGIAILLFPQLLVALIAAMFILFGLGIMATSWQFRRWHKASESRFINWITRF